MRALVVDDSRAMRAMIGRMLIDLGFEVLEAGHGRQALQVIQESDPIDVALVDWNMPEMDGLSLVSAVRKDRKLDSMRLIMVTTETEQKRMQEALRAGVDEYMMKPFTDEILAGKLSLLGIRRAP